MAGLFPKKKLDDAMLRSQYAGYRKKMAKNPESIIKTLSYENWKKQRKES